MLTLLIVILIVLMLINWRGPVPADAQGTIWVILLVFLLMWLLFATGVISHYGYWN